MELIKLLLIFSFVYSTTCIFKFTKVDCDCLNKSVAIISRCRLKAVSREISKFYFNLTFLQPANAVQIRLRALTRETAGYRTFLGMDYTFDACEYFVKRNNPITNLVFNQMRPFTNINHTCPYSGNVLVDGLYLNHALYNLPLPNGEYAVWMTWYFNEVLTLQTNVFLEFKFADN